MATLASAPYQERLDQFLNKYRKAFADSLVTGPTESNAGGAGEKVPESALSGKEQVDLETRRLLARSVDPTVMREIIGFARAEKPIPGHRMVRPTDYGFEGRQSAMSRSATPIPHVSTSFSGFNPTALAGEPDFARSRPVEMGGGAGGSYMPDEINTPDTNPMATPSSPGWTNYGPGIDYKLGPENPSGDAAAIQRMKAATAQGGYYDPRLGRVDASNFPVPAERSYYDAHPEEALFQKIQEANKPIMDSYQKAVDYNKTIAQGYGLSMDPKVAAVQRAQAMKNLADLEERGPLYANVNAGAFEKLFKTATENAPGSPENLLRMAHADYYNRMAGVYESGLPMDQFKNYAAGMNYMRDAEKPVLIPPGYSYQTDKGWVTSPMPSEKTNPLIVQMMKDVGEQRKFSMAAGQQFDYNAAMRENLKSIKAFMPKEDWAALPQEFKKEPKAQWTAKLVNVLKAKKVSPTQAEIDQAYQKYLETE